MNTTLKQMTLPTPKGDEVLDMTEFATNESVVNGLASVESKVETEADSIEAKIDESVNTLSSKIDNIKLPEIDTTELAKESTLNAVSSKLDNLNVEVDLSSVSKQGENQEATNTAIYDTLNYIKDDVIDIVQSQLTEVDNLLDF